MEKASLPFMPPSPSPKKENDKQKGCTINFPQRVHSIVSVIRRLYFPGQASI